MELLKNLSEKELTQLRETFNAKEGNALTIEEFEEVMIGACRRKNIEWRNLKLRELFCDVDADGNGTCSWQEFTDFAIKGATNADKGEGTKDGAVKEYRHVGTLMNEVPGSVVQTWFCEKENLIVKLLRTGRFSKIKLCKNTLHMPLYRETPKPQNEDATIVASCIIPTTKEVTCSGVLAAAYSDSVVRFFDIHRKNHLEPNVMVVRKELTLSEGQTALAWCERYRRLICGSRSGVVSVVDVDQEATVGKERIHSLLVCDMIVRDAHLYTASVDPEGGVKAVDMEHSVVKFALSGHSQGAYRIALNTEFQQLYSVGFELEPLVYSLTTPRMAPYKLVDSNRPHHKRIVGIEAVPGTPQVITADITGIVKVWDVRMYNCVQTITSARNEIKETAMLSSIGYIGSRNRLVINGRDTKTYEYDMSSNPQLADEAPCSAALFNPVSRSFMTVHGGGVKLWDSSTGVLRGNHKCVRHPDEEAPAFTEEISAVCLALPLGRKFFLGTAEGGLYSVSYAVCEVMRRFSRKYCATPPKQREIVQLEYVDGFKDNSFPYVLVVLKRELVLVADAEEHVQRSNLPLRCFDAVLESTIAKSATLAATSRILCSTANGCVHIADLTTFTLVHSIATDFVGEVLSLCALPVDHCGTFPSALCFCSDSTQITALFVSSAREFEVLCKFGRSIQPTAPPPPQQNHHLPPSRRRLSIVVPEPPPLPLGGSRPNSAVAGYFSQTRDVIYTTIVTTLAVLERWQLVVAGDERGMVRVYDIAELVAFAVALSTTTTTTTGADSSDLVVPDAFNVPLVRQWRAHESEVTTVKVVDDNTDAPKLLTCADREVMLWSLDGVALGNLAQGRTHDGPLAPRMHPFVFDSAPTEAWAETATLVASRVAANSARSSQQQQQKQLDAASPLDELNAGVADVEPFELPLSASAPSALPELGAPSGGGGAPFFLTDLITSLDVTHTRAMLSHSGTSSAVPTEAQLLSFPSRLHGLVNVARVDFGSVRPGGFKARAQPLQPTLPPLPLTPRGTASGPTQTMTSARVMTERSRSISAAAVPVNKRREFVKFSKSTAQYLRSMGVDDNPLETPEQRRLRNSGRVVIGASSAEPSTRVL